MKANDFIDKVQESENFDKKYNLTFELLDEFNLLGLKKEAKPDLKVKPEEQFA